MKSQPLFTRSNGDICYVSHAGVLILAADTAYGPPTETTSEGMRTAMALIDGILTAARAGGYTQGDILRTLFARNQLTHRILEMAQAACDAAGHVAIGAVLARLGLA